MQYYGAHPSVVEPVELVKDANGDDVLIAYSLGNYISAFKYENADVEMILNITIAKNEREGKTIIESADYVPVYVLDNGRSSEDRFKLVDMKKLALEYDEKNNNINRKTYDKIIKKLTWLNDLIVK